MKEPTVEEMARELAKQPMLSDSEIYQIGYWGKSQIRAAYEKMKKGAAHE